MEKAAREYIIIATFGWGWISCWQLEFLPQCSNLPHEVLKLALSLDGLYPLQRSQVFGP
jgi:hypothetical protein